jgi:hypothetical protein
VLTTRRQRKIIFIFSPVLRAALTTRQTDDHLVQRVGFQTDAADSIVVDHKVAHGDRDARELR